MSAISLAISLFTITHLIVIACLVISRVHPTVVLSVIACLIIITHSVDVTSLVVIVILLIILIIIVIF